MIPDNGVFIQLHEDHESRLQLQSWRSEFKRRSRSYQGNELFLGILLLSEMPQEQSLDIRRQERILLRHTVVGRHGIGSCRVNCFLGHRDARCHRFFLQRRAQTDLKLHDP